MRIRHLLLAAALLSGGCRRGEAGDDAGIPPGPVPQKPKPELASNTSLDCGKLVPQQVRDTWLKDWTAEPAEALAEKVPGAPKFCNFVKGSSANQVKLAFDCRRRPTDEEVERMKKALLEIEGKELPGLGRAGVQQNPMPNMTQVTTWDPDSPCYLLVTWLGDGNEQAAALARQLLETTSGASLVPGPPLPPGGPGGR